MARPPAERVQASSLSPIDLSPPGRGHHGQPFDGRGDPGLVPWPTVPPAGERRRPRPVPDRGPMAGAVRAVPVRDRRTAGTVQGALTDAGGDSAVARSATMRVDRDWRRSGS